MKTKSQLREDFLRQRREASAEEKKRIEQGIEQNLFCMDSFMQAKNIFLYYSTEEEISTQKILLFCLEKGKTVCLPKCLPKNQMTARQIHSLDDLTDQTFGIPEPGAHCVEIPPEKLDFCIVPALACDRDGYRLGYGGGFYDRYLPRTHGITAALCASKRLLDRLPSEPFDVPCKCIITENEVWNL